MNRYYIVLLVLVVLFSCSKKDGEWSDEYMVISEIGDNNYFENGIYFDLNEYEKILTFHANNNWFVEKMDEGYGTSWLETSLTFGNSGDINLSLYVKDNLKSDTRTLVLCINAKNEIKKIRITQKQKRLILSSPSTINIGSNGGNVSLEVKSDGNYDVVIADNCKRWITQLTTKELQPSTINLYIANNNSSEERMGEIVITNGILAETVIIIQSGKKEPSSYDIESGGLYYKIVSITDLAVYIVGGEGVYSGDIVIPDYIEYNGKVLNVTGIYEHCFENSSIESIKIGHNVKTIEDYAFHGCKKLSTISIPASVTTIIGGNSFAYCTNLKNLSFEDGIYELKFNKYSISSACFEACPIETLYLGRTIYCPFYKPFGNLSNLTKVTIGHYVTRLCSELFSEAELLSEIVIPASVICIEPYVFMNCRQLNKVVFEDGDSELLYETAPFGDCPLNTVYLGRHLVGSSAALPIFKEKPIKDLTIGTTITSLCSFTYCRELEKVEIPANIKTIGSFTGCEKLTTVICHSLEPPTTDWGGFGYSTYANGVLYVPKSSISLYSTSSPWKNFFSIKPID